MEKKVIVVGGGHAGCEAALACARLGIPTLMVTGSLDRIAAMSCNPAIGGVGKGHLVKEIDALGGEMARVADATGIHFRTLNSSRGPAVRATRCQSDMERYRQEMTRVVTHTPNLSLRQDDVTGLVVGEDGCIKGVTTRHSGELLADCVILTTGTFLGGQLHYGESRTEGGRAGEAPAKGLSASLSAHGLQLGRLKTGTCPRLDGRTINYSILEEQPGETPAPLFSFESQAPLLPQISCYLTSTNAHTHQVIQDAVQSGLAPIYNGQIGGTGPRYCPSIEDKVVRFSQKEGHLIFLEPHGLDTYEVYPNGISTSLPPRVQLDFLRTIKGLEQVEVTRWGYAVEYDFVHPTQLHSTLETKLIKGLYCAGQLNGTTGYEEAAAQGLMAGLNAAMALLNKEPIILPRHVAYLGVMIDDLVTKGTQEPYRMFTSRAEHRLLLREDNVYARLMDIGLASGLLSPQRHARMQAFEEAARAEVPYVNQGKREGVDARVYERALVEAKYAGYIERAQKTIEKDRALEEAVIPESLLDAQLPGISNEVFEKLRTIRPRTLGQASRVSGITPAAVSLLAVQIRKQEQYAR